MAGLFQPTITSTSSLPVTPTGVDTSSAPVAGEVLKGVSRFVEIAKDKNKEKILSDFQNRISKIQQAASTSPNFSKDKFRIAISKTIQDFKQSAPSLSSEFDALAGGSSSLIPKSAFEKGIEETQKRVAELIPLLGEEGAFETVKAEAEARREKLLLAKKEKEGTVKAVDYEIQVNKGIDSDASWFYNSLDTLVENNPDGLDKALINQLKLELSKREQEKLSLLRKGLSNSADTKEIRILIENTSKEYKKLKETLDNLDSYSVITERAKSLEASDKIYARDLFPVASIVSTIDKTAAGQLVNSILKGNSLISSTFKKNKPELFKNRDDYSKNLVRGFNKLYDAIGSDRAFKKMNQLEAIAVSSKIATSGDVVENIATTSQDKERVAEMRKLLTQIHSSDPQSLVGYRNAAFKVKLQENYKKYGWMVESGIDGAISSFMASYRQDTGKFPENIKVFTGTPSEGSKPPLVSFVKGITENSVQIEGEGLTQEHKDFILEAYKTIQSNPSILRNVEKNLGLPDESLNPQEYLTILVNGQLPADSVKAREIFLKDKSKGTLGESFVSDSLNKKVTTDTTKPKEAASDEKLFNALEDSSDEEISKFRKALREAKTASEKAEVHAAFLDGAFSIVR